MEYKFSTEKGFCIIRESGLYFSDNSTSEPQKYIKTNNLVDVDNNKHLGKIAIFLSETCNLKCMYCYADSGKGIRVVSINSARALIDFICTKSDYFILDFHGGGEPLLFFNLIKEIYEYAKSTGKLFRTVLITNGYIINRRQEILNWIIEHIDILAISCDGKPDIQDMQRPTDMNSKSSEIVESTISYLSNLDYGFTVRATVTGSSDDVMLDNIKYFHSLGVKNIIFSPCYNYGRSNNVELLPNPKKYVKSFMEAFDFAYKNDLTLKTTSFRMPGKTYCGALPAFNICLTVDDYITTCYEVTCKEDSASDLFFVGEVRDGKIQLFKDRLYNLKNAQLNRINCEKCECRLVCRGGCPVKQYRNSAQAANNLCAITKLLVPQIINYIHNNPDSAKCILKNADIIYDSL